jgi:DNA polymerase-3 subunit delta
MADIKPAYLISGEDESRIDAWRARLRTRAEEDPAATLEVLKEDRLTGEAAAEEITALTLSMGRRYVLADGVQRWKDRDVKEVVAALARLPAETVVVFIALGESPKGLEKAVKACGGDVHDYPAVAPRAYPAWARERAGELGFELEREAAEALVARVPRDEKKRRLRQQSLLRELEKLAIFAGENATVDANDVELLTTSAVETQTYELADAVIEGNRERALSLAEKLLSQDEDMIVILYALRRKLRDSHRAWAMVNSGKSLGEVQSALGVPGFIAKRIVSQVKKLDGERFERALDLLAELDWSIRGGSSRNPESALTLMLAGAGGAETNRELA